MKNNMTLGITLIIIGIVSIIVGVIVLNKKENTPVAPTEKLSIAPIEKESPKTPSDKEKGDDFEKYVVQKFSKSTSPLLNGQVINM